MACERTSETIKIESLKIHDRNLGEQQHERAAEIEPSFTMA